MRAPLLAVSAVLLASAAQARTPQGQSPYYMDGEQLLSYCSQDDDLSKGACSGYVAGAIDMIATMNLARRRVLVCVPPEMELRRLADIVVARLRDQPDLRRSAATGQIIVALGEAFPCNGAQAGVGLDQPAEHEQLDQPEQPPPEQPQADQADQPQQTQQSDGTEPPEPQRLEPLQPDQIRPERPWPDQLRPEQPWPDQPWPDQQW